ncbi:MAG: Octaprenyl diphosphate synthase / Dimethylallyltransferase / (2E,6E)-farnesyl diphosphate synthase / Geranylgeranyl pyrophosphate synthetase [uncultured Phycisphaerae bacterium]|uniref:Octaprenyl diphosphate synthase / Dimethylallyltransferase / (2E,6E)-farnesyl diphosphate synthase / Geranylgeranyl pyrophosphate synthetase n=1 Tax=uncultured Phycisphaerae bacterium TaxID=904963 RepID=A0A6J4QBF8_9BACT|nr:MAG: Octaprenyl diphosphate synthase / Dimethylallyltransferase / (2E,6E)-farnesyl diphosphate synthase / Geranylgeranyl pyrophosphate synthetase [uncultured Phycisphaerae bacterium]
MTSALASLTDCIRPQLAAVEKLFHDELASDLSCVNTLIKHVSRFRGKMLRPCLVLLSGRACGEVTEAHTVIATVVEMVHMATLVHDDVLDEAELRRKGATINHLRGNEAAVMLGDYLISHSYHLCASLDSQIASRLIARTTNQVCEGELLQLDNRNNVDLDEETYLEIITRKTASLCATCALLGAEFAGAGKAVVGRMELFGLSLGVAFQMQDDILDLAGDTRTVGKTLGIDLEKGKMTLPVIHFLRHAPPERRAALRALLTGDDPDMADRVREMVVPSASMEYARGRAREYAGRAREALQALPDSDARRLLERMAEFVVSRPL